MKKYCSARPISLRQAVHERTQDGLLEVFRQIACQLLRLSLFKREAILAGNQLSQLRTTEGLIAVVQQFVVTQHLQAGGFRPDFEQCDQGVLTLTGQSLNQSFHRQPGGIRFDIENGRLQSCCLGQTLTVLHAIPCETPQS